MTTPGEAEDPATDSYELVVDYADNEGKTRFKVFEGIWLFRDQPTSSGEFATAVLTDGDLIYLKLSHEPIFEDPSTVGYYTSLTSYLRSENCDQQIATALAESLQKLCEGCRERLRYRSGR